MQTASGASVEEELGRIVRDAWSKAVCELIPNHPPSWERSWEDTPPLWREVNSRVGIAVADFVKDQRTTTSGE